jgi:hypothetical protein
MKSIAKLLPGIFFINFEIPFPEHSFVSFGRLKTDIARFHLPYFSPMLREEITLSVNLPFLYLYTITDQGVHGFQRNPT